MAGSPNLGGRLADILSRAHVDTKMKLMPEWVRMAMQMQEAFFTLTGNEHKATTGGYWQKMIDTGKLSGPSLATAEFLANGHGQWQTLLAGTATGAAMGMGILDIFTNEFAPAVYEVLSANPHKLLAPADLAVAAGRGVMSYETAVHEAAKGGLNQGNFDVLRVLNLSVPSPGDMGQLINRGSVDLARARQDLRRGGLDPAYIDWMLDLREQPLSASDLAALVTFGVLTEDKAAPMARLSGVSTADFHLLVQGNGQPPSNEELVFAYRRKIIDKARLLRGITQGPTRNEWFDVIESLRSVPMSTADAVEASIQGHLTKVAAQTIAEQNGLLSEHFEPLWQTAGSPLGQEHMVSLLNRRLMSETQVRQGLTESRLKPKYIDLVIASRTALPPMTVIRSSYSKGAITHSRALDLLAQHGYSHEDADMVLAEAHAVKTETIRHITVGQITELYTERAIDQAAAHDMLSSLGYSDADVAWILDLADIARHRHLIAAELTTLKSQYVGRHIDENQVQAALDTLGIPSAQRDDLFFIWDLQRQTVTKTLTLAQVTSAMKKGVIDQGEFEQRVLGMGYSPNDLPILLALATPAAAQ